MIDVMIDIETLGTAPGSVVLSAAVVADTGAELYRRLHPNEQIYLGMKMDPATIEWWRQQPKAVFDQAMSPQDAQPLALVLDDLTKYLAALREGSAEQPDGEHLRIWGDGAAFDLVLLECLYKADQTRVPWSYREVHCYRTLRQLANSTKPASKVHHDALSDARAQLKHLKELLRSYNVT